MSHTLEPSLSVLILGLNEEDSIVQCIEEVIYACSRLTAPFEVIVVNDGSKDRMGERADACAAKYPDVVRVIHNKKNMGYGGAFKIGLLQARMNYCTLVGAINAIDKESLAHIFSRTGKADLILTYIANPELRPLVRRVLSEIHTKFVDLLFGYRVKYYLGCIIFPTQQIARRKFTSAHGFLMVLTLELFDEGKTHEMVPMTLKRRIREHSTALKFRNVWRVLANLCSTYYRLRIRRRKPII